MREIWILVCVDHDLQTQLDTVATYNQGGVHLAHLPFALSSAWTSFTMVWPRLHWFSALSKARQGAVQTPDWAAIGEEERPTEEDVWQNDRTLPATAPTYK